MNNVRYEEIGMVKRLLLKGERHEIEKGLLLFLQENEENLGRVVCLEYEGEDLNSLSIQEGVIEFSGFTSASDLSESIFEVEKIRQFADTFDRWVHWKCKWVAVWINVRYRWF